MLGGLSGLPLSLPKTEIKAFIANSSYEYLQDTYKELKEKLWITWAKSEQSSAPPLLSADLLGTQLTGSTVFVQTFNGVVETARDADHFGVVTARITCLTPIFSSEAY